MTTSQVSRGFTFLTSDLYIYIAGDRGSVTLEDRANLPFTEATLLEVGQFHQAKTNFLSFKFQVARLASVLPIAPPRKIPSDVTVGDFILPAGMFLR